MGVLQPPQYTAWLIVPRATNGYSPGVVQTVVCAFRCIMKLFAPKLREDVQLSQQQTAAGAVAVLKEPVSGNYFRLREAEQFIVRQFDGETPLETIRTRTEQHFEAALPADTLTAFVEKLRRSGLLDTQDASARSTRRQRRANGSLLYLRFRLFDPSSLFESIVPHLRWMFTPSFLVFSATVILMGAIIAAANWDEYIEHLARMYRVSSVPLFIGIGFFVVVIHECAHGLTCKYFGGEVREIGFLLIYFQPALYCNVSDAWLFPEKSRRLWVGFAGPYIELLVWALATLTWRVSDPETWFSSIALIIMTTSGIKTLLNFNPFLKLDGYYLLSDYLEVPNLRRNAFRYVGDLLKRLVGIEIPSPDRRTMRERRIYAIYGVIATVSTFSLVAYIIVAAGSALIENADPLVLLLSSALVALRFRRRLHRLFSRSSGYVDEDEGDMVGAEKDSNATAQLQTRDRPNRRREWVRVMRRVALVAAAFALCFAASRSRLELRVTGPFTILPRESTEIRSAVEGIVDAIHVNEGDEVRPRQLLARLADRDLRAELEKTDAEIKEIAAGVKLLRIGPTHEEIEVARAAVTKADARLRYAQYREERAKLLISEGLRPRKDYDEAHEQTAVASDEAAEARSRLDVVLSGSRQEAIDGAGARMDRLQAHRRHLNGQLQLLNILSPAAGIVATPNRQLNDMRNALVRKGDSILKIYDVKSVTAQISISEKEIEGVEVGQPVVLRTRAYPDRDFHGRVASIATSALTTSGTSTQASTAAPSAQSSGTNRTILVYTEIENGSSLLRSELSGHARIYCGEKSAWDIFVRRFVRFFRVELWSLW